MIDLEKIKQEKSLKELLEFGILNIDKPSNYTSFQVAEIVGKLVEARKFSHFGTLDPKTSGVLPVALNRACKLTGWFMKKNKTYIGIMKIHKEISEEKLKEEMQKFIGKIKQLPPVKSRVKREVREREVYSWKILEFDEERKEVLFEAEVEAGTYIRKLISDLGLRIGGAHMLELRRVKAGIFEETDSINLYELEKIKDDELELRKIIIPAEIIAEILPSFQLKNKEKLKQILTGKPLFINDVELDLREGENFVLFMEDRFIGVYKKVNENEIVGRADFVYN